MNPIIHVTLGVMLQTGSVGSAVNQIFNTVISPFFQALLMVGGIAFLVSIMMILYNFIEYLIHPVSYGRTGALNEVFGHGRRIIFGALGLWLIIYLIFLIGSLVGATGANPAQVATQVFTAEFKLLYYYLSKALTSATSTTP